MTAELAAAADRCYARGVSGGERTLSYERFWFAFTVWLVASSVLVGSVETVQFAHGLRKFGGLEYTGRVVALSAIRVFGPALVFSATLVAWMTWSHRMDPERVRSSLFGVALRAAIVGLASYPLAVALLFAASASITQLVYGIDWRFVLSTALSVVGWLDLGRGALSTLCSLAAAVVLAALLMPHVASLAWSLPRKIVTLIAAFAVLRGALSLTDSTLRLFGRRQVRVLAPRPITEQQVQDDERNHESEDRLHDPNEHV